MDKLAVKDALSDATYASRTILHLLWVCLWVLLQAAWQIAPMILVAILKFSYRGLVCMWPLFGVWYILAPIVGIARITLFEAWVVYVGLGILRVKYIPTIKVPSEYEELFQWLLDTPKEKQPGEEVAREDS